MWGHICWYFSAYACCIFRYLLYSTCSTWRLSYSYFLPILLVHPSASTYAGRYDMHDLPPCVCAGKKEGNLHWVGIEMRGKAPRQRTFGEGRHSPLPTHYIYVSLQFPPPWLTILNCKINQLLAKPYRFLWAGGGLGFVDLMWVGWVMSHEAEATIFMHHDHVISQGHPPVHPIHLSLDQSEG